MIILTAQPSNNIQQYLDVLSIYGGGVLNLNPVGVFTVEEDINIPSNTTLNGNGATIDFNNTAYGIKIIGTALNPKISCSLSKLNIINSTTIGVECEYTENPILNLLDNVLVNNCAIGIQLSNCDGSSLLGTFSNNGINCIMNNVSSFETNFSEFSNSTSEDGFVLNGCSTATIFNSGFDENTGDGITMIDCEYITLTSNSIYNNGADGLKLISGNTAIILNGTDISYNTGKGINIVDNTSVNTLIVSNTFDGNSSAIDDNGTTTLIRSNIGVSDSI